MAATTHEWCKFANGAPVIVAEEEFRRLKGEVTGAAPFFIAATEVRCGNALNLLAITRSRFVSLGGPLICAVP